MSKEESCKKTVETVINNYEDLLKNIQAEVDFYKREHESIRKEVNCVIEDNQKISEFFSAKNKEPASVHFENHKKITDSVIQNLKNQIKYIDDEKNSFEHLWKTSQKTISNLEIEVSEYKKYLSSGTISVVDVRKEYSVGIKKLESKIQQLTDELNKQMIINQNLAETNSKVTENFKTIDEKYKIVLGELSKSLERNRDTEKALIDSKNKNSELIKNRMELEECLNKANAIAREHMIRETEAIRKVQEALQVAETAMLEKNASLIRERDISEECDHLATTIGQVMEEAAKKVESDMEEMKKNYKERIRKQDQVIAKMKSALELQSKKNNVSESRLEKLENQLKVTVHSNLSLDADLQLATKTIVEMEVKLEAFQKLFVKEEETNRICEEKSKQLEEFIRNNKKLKVRWKETVDEFTGKLQNEIKDLERIKTDLETENLDLKRRLFS